MLLVLITAIGVGGATVIGALIGFMFRNISQKYNNAILGFAAGVMLAAAVIGLIIPSAEMTGRSGIWMTVLGIFFGAIFLNFMDKLTPHLHICPELTSKNMRITNRWTKSCCLCLQLQFTISRKGWRQASDLEAKI